MNVIYGIVLTSIVMTSLLIILIEKTKLADLYQWFFSPGIPKLGFKITLPAGIMRKSKAKSAKVTPIGSKLFTSDKK